jgi:hypothetical protein
VTVTPPAPAKLADAVPAAPRTKPQQVAAALQLASADAQLVQPPKPKQAAADKAEPQPPTPADIVSARGFWGDNPSTPTQATPAQVVAAISARQALEAADPRPTSSVPAAYQAMAYAPQAAAPGDRAQVDRAQVVTASAPIPRSSRPISLARNSAPATGIDTVATKGAQDDDSLIATSTRLAAATNNGIWMRIVMLAPSATTSMSVTMMGDADLTVMRSFFVKPQAAIAIGFSDDPMMGMDCDHFSGPATIKLETISFGLRTALLH